MTDFSSGAIVPKRISCHALRLLVPRLRSVSRHFLASPQLDDSDFSEASNRAYAGVF
jgi:hypothetical protein